MPSDPIPPASDGRHEGGRFAPGNRFGKGNPHLRKMHALRASLLGSVDEGAMKEVGERLTSLARGGDLDAIKILLAYTIGKPPTSIALTGPEGEPLGLDWPAVQSAIMDALARFPEARLAVALSLTRITDDARGTGEPGAGA